MNDLSTVKPLYPGAFPQPDAGEDTFPQGIPNPLLTENRPATAEAVRAAGADFGIAWDGDFDRCFFFDHTGAFIDGEYVVGLLAEAFLAKDPGATIIHDPRIIRNTQDLVAKVGGRAVRLNVEARGNAELVVEGVDRLKRVLLG